MNILITGATGFIGSNLVTFLSKKKHNLFLISKTKKYKLQKRNIISIKSDINFNQKVLKKLIKFCPEVLIHLAWSGLPDYTKKNSNKNFSNQKKFFLKLYNITSLRKIIITGSCSEHKDKEYLTSKYFTKAKIKIKNLAKKIFKDNKLYLIWIRLFFVYGKNQNKRSLIPRIINSVRNGNEFQFLNPNAKHDYINVSDVVNFINLNLEYNRSYECDLGCSFSIKINDIYYFIKSALQDSAIKKLKKYKGGFVAKKINLKKISWKPLVSIEKGILQLLK